MEMQVKVTFCIPDRKSELDQAAFFLCRRFSPFLDPSEWAVRGYPGNNAEEGALKGNEMRSDDSSGCASVVSRSFGNAEEVEASIGAARIPASLCKRKRTKDATCLL